MKSNIARHRDKCNTPSTDNNATTTTLQATKLHWAYVSGHHVLACSRCWRPLTNLAEANMVGMEKETTMKRNGTAVGIYCWPCDKLSRVKGGWTRMSGLFKVVDR